MELLGELLADVEDALDEVRDLAHGIYPPILADLGLVRALTAAAKRSTLPVQVAATAAGRFSPDVEAAVYFCCLEALQNAGKYAGPGARAKVDLREEERRLVFEISDDGAGFDPRAARAGAGLTNMADRIGGIGGILRIESTPGRGTTVYATVPL